MEMGMDIDGYQDDRIIEDEEEFLEDVEEFMRVRGVSFEREGRVAGRPIELHKLYRVVMSKGGYDAVTATRMMWREVATYFPLPKQHDGAVSYQLKQVYYKNLAAYEIYKYWGETPPSPRLLEKTTAKGGDVRKRTHEAMSGHSPLPSLPPRQMEQQVMEDIQHTPKQEKVEPDDPGSASRYPSRLRQQPKPVQHYQSDPLASRSIRGRTTHSPQPGPIPLQAAFSNSSSNPRDPNFKIEHYEPRQSVPLALRPLVTPSSHGELFYQRKAAASLPQVSRTPLPQDLLRYALPKSAFDGPNIYVRCVQGLKSGIRREQDFALHHLVKVSHERGDKFKFEGFPTLAESLMEKVVEVIDLAYGVPFQVSYMHARGQHARNTLNAVHGTEGLAEQLAELTPFLTDDGIEPEDYNLRLEKVNEATLVIRNMVTLEENAIFLSKMALFRDILIVLLNLPKQSRFDEVKQYALDMAEMTSRFYPMSPSDELYQALVEELASSDRGKVLSALRAIYRFDADADRVHPILDIPIGTIEKLVQCCLLEDDELLEAVVSFLYMWTAFEENLSWITRESPHLFPGITPRLTKLLIHGAITQEESVPTQRPATVAPASPASIPLVPEDLLAQMLTYSEPERSAKWLKCCFEESPIGDVTQISIWQAYQNRFLHHQHIPAADFIKQVSNTISGAQAQVVQMPGAQSRFIIKGITPRRVLQGLNGQPYYKCHWEVSQPQSTTQAARSGPCNSWHATPEMLWSHMLEAHAQIPRTEDGKFQSKDLTVPSEGLRCRWIGCRKHTRIETPAALGRHLRLHVPENAEQNRELILKLAGEQTKSKEETHVKHTYYFTSTDERGWPSGVPFMSALLLFNLARFVGRSERSQKSKQELMALLFSAKVRDNLWNTFSKHRTIAGLIVDVLRYIDKGEAAEKKVTKVVEEDSTIF